MAPPLTSAQALYSPTAIPVAPPSMPLTATGTRLVAAVVVLLPSTPLVLSPQHWMVPPATAHAVDQPADTEVTPVVSPET